MRLQISRDKTGKNKNSGKAVHSVKAEWFRIFAGQSFWAVAILGALMKVMECYAYPGLGISSNIMYGYRESVPYYMDLLEACLLPYVVIALCALPAASFYAEECQKGALSMRLQRMGAGKYVRSRIFCAAGSAFLSMLLVDLLASFFIAVPLGQDFLPEYSYIKSALLDDGYYFTYWVMGMWKDSLEAAFYSVLTVGISVFLTNRQALAAVPAILRYGFDALQSIINVEWMKAFLPRRIYTNIGVAAFYMGVSEPVMAIIMLLYTMAAGFLCGGLLYLRVRDRLHVSLPVAMRDKKVKPENKEKQRTKGNGGGCIHGAFSVARYELYMVFFSAKFWVLILLAVIFMKYFIGDITQFAVDYGLTFPPAVLPFYYSGDVFCNLGFLIFIFLISDAPFRENNQVYLLERSGRRGLCIGQLVSLCVISVLFTAIQFVISVLMSLPRISLSGWGKVWGSIADGLTGDLGYNINAQVSQNIISTYTPWQAILTSFVLISLMGMCYGMIAYLLNNLGSGKLGTIVLSIWSLGWLFLSNMAGNLVIRKLLQLSTQRWLNLDYLDWEELPGHILTICVVILVLAVMNVLVDRRKQR